MLWSPKALLSVPVVIFYPFSSNVPDSDLRYIEELAGLNSILGSAPQGGFPTELISDEDMERDLCDWRRMNVLYLYECDSMNVCIS